MSAIHEFNVRNLMIRYDNGNFESTVGNFLDASPGRQEAILREPYVASFGEFVDALRREMDVALGICGTVEIAAIAGMVTTPLDEAYSYLASSLLNNHSIVSYLDRYPRPLLWLHRQRLVRSGQFAFRAERDLHELILVKRFLMNDSLIHDDIQTQYFLTAMLYEGREHELYRIITQDLPETQYYVRMQSGLGAEQFEIVVHALNVLKAFFIDLDSILKRGERSFDLTQAMLNNYAWIWQRGEVLRDVLLFAWTLLERRRVETSVSLGQEIDVEFDNQAAMKAVSRLMRPSPEAGTDSSPLLAQ